MQDPASESPPDLLTPRQLEVLELMAKGLTNKEIGGVLEISPGTAKVHVAAVIKALDVTNRTEATNRLHELGLGADQQQLAEAFKVRGFGDRPAIAVLPFDNLSNDPNQTFLADGLVEDLITCLAGWRWFPVLSRNSTFVHKGKPVEIKEVSRALGARYIIEGSVRAAGARVRVTVQVLDGSSGEHVWAKQYDRELANVFEVTDEIVASIVSSLEPALLRIGGLRVRSHRPDQLSAWENFERAYVHVGENRLAGFVAAQACLDQATKLDPQFSAAWALSTFCQFNLFLLGIQDSANDPLIRLAQAADKLIELDTTDPFAPLGIGMSRLANGDHVGALSAMRRAVELGPSLIFANWGMGCAAGANGNPTEAIDWMDRALRLSHEDPIMVTAHMTRGVQFMLLNRFEEAEREYQIALEIGPELPHAYFQLASFHAMRGEHEQAQDLIARMHSIQPDYSPLIAMRALTPPALHEGLDSILALVGL